MNKFPENIALRLFFLRAIDIQPFQRKGKKKILNV